MEKTNLKKSEKSKNKSSSKIKARSWKEIISEKFLTDYALPITKNAEERLHKFNKQIESEHANT